MLEDFVFTKKNVSQFELYIYTLCMWWCLKCDIKSKYKKKSSKETWREVLKPEKYNVNATLSYFIRWSLR